MERTSPTRFGIEVPRLKCEHQSIDNLTPQEFAEITLPKAKERLSLPADSSRNSD
jgi:hypothetical protein